MKVKKTITNNRTRLITSVTGIQKLLVAICLAIGSYFLLLIFPLETSSRILLSWNTFCLFLIGFNWLLFFSTSSEELHLVVAEQDDNLKVIFAIILVAVCFSVFGTLVLLTTNNSSGINKIFHAIICLSSVTLSWFLLHTIFAIRYAHLYHANNQVTTETKIGGIDFPSQAPPDYLDFAYFSFVIGMTFQVSDISISSNLIRRFVLMHSLIAFVFNTIIVALTINTIAGL